MCREISLDHLGAFAFLGAHAALVVAGLSLAFEPLAILFPWGHPLVVALIHLLTQGWILGSALAAISLFGSRAFQLAPTPPTPPGSSGVLGERDSPVCFQPLSRHPLPSRLRRPAPQPGFGIGRARVGFSFPSRFEAFRDPSAGVCAFGSPACWCGFLGRLGICVQLPPNGSSSRCAVRSPCCALLPGGFWLDRNLGQRSGVPDDTDDARDSIAQAPHDPFHHLRLCRGCRHGCTRPCERLNLSGLARPPCTHSHNFAAGCRPPLGSSQSPPSLKTALAAGSWVLLGGAGYRLLCALRRHGARCAPFRSPLWLLARLTSHSSLEPGVRLGRGEHPRGRSLEPLCPLPRLAARTMGSCRKATCEGPGSGRSFYPSLDRCHHLEPWCLRTLRGLLVNPTRSRPLERGSFFDCRVGKYSHLARQPKGFSAIKKEKRVFRANLNSFGGDVERARRRKKLDKQGFHVLLPVVEGKTLLPEEKLEWSCRQTLVQETSRFSRDLRNLRCHGSDPALPVVPSFISKSPRVCRAFVRGGLGRLFLRRVQSSDPAFHLALRASFGMFR